MSLPAAKMREKGRRQPVGEDVGMLSRLRQRIVRAIAGTRLYRHTLVGRIPSDLEINVGQRWPGEPKRGEALLAGEIELAGEIVRSPSPLWSPPGVGADWLDRWHGFGWLTDLLATGAAGRQRARELIDSWLADNPASHRLGWRSDVLASRIFAWIAHFEELAPRETDEALRQRMLTSLSSQLRHLARTASWEVAGAGRLRALKGLVAGLVALAPSQSRLGRALKALEREVAVQVLGDGGHRSRSPSQQLWVLRDLVDLRGVLRAADIPVPGALHGAIERMAPMLRFFRHGDRRLALFNGSLEEDGVLIDLVLTRSESKGRAPLQAPNSGFSRLVAEKALVLVDVGGPPPPGFDDRAHAGTLSFEFSHERERIIVNCGGYRGAKANWRRVARASAAHSVLVVADTNSTEIREDGTLGRVPGAVTSERAEDGGRQWIIAGHDGYRERFGLNYSRQLFLAASGEDLRGEDRLSGLPGARFAVRFHLHPAVQASLGDDGGSALLRLPSGNLWRLRAAGAEMSLGESIYLGSGEARKTQQVVLSGAVAPEGASVRWAIRREPRKAAEE
jgi:uncharacterized heparinase superfamily protein